MSLPRGPKLELIEAAEGRVVNGDEEGANLCLSLKTMTEEQAARCTTTQREEVESSNRSVFVFIFQLGNAASKPLVATVPSDAFEDEKSEMLDSLNGFQSDDSILLLDSIREGHCSSSALMVGWLAIRASGLPYSYRLGHSFVFLTNHSSHSRIFKTTIAVQFTPIQSIDKYELEWKQFEREWNTPDGNTTLSVGEGDKKMKGEASNLAPGMTYCVRAICVDARGDKGVPGPELIIDTEQVGCTPKSEKSCCVVQ